MHREHLPSQRFEGPNLPSSCLSEFSFECVHYVSSSYPSPETSPRVNAGARPDSPLQSITPPIQLHNIDSQIQKSLHRSPSRCGVDAHHHQVLPSATDCLDWE